jgi:hypothetical protein
MRAHPFIKAIVQKDTRVWLVFLIFLPLLLNTIRNPYNDFGTIAAIVRDWVAGKTALYAPGSAYFSYTPWSLLVYLPLSLIPHPFGQLIFNITSVCLLIWSVWYAAQPIGWKAMAISLATIYTSMLVIQGQFDALILASLTVGWIAFKRENPWLMGIALVGMTCKYTYVVLPLILIIIAARVWPVKKILYAAITPVLIFFFSFFVAGWDWPLRYSTLMSVEYQIYKQYEVQTVFAKTLYPVSYWLFHPPIGYIITGIISIISVYLLFRTSRKKIDQDAINFALAINLVISPYFTFHHGIYLAPLHAKLLKKIQVYGFILFGAALLDILLLWIGVGLITYPFVALLILILITFSNLRKTQPTIIETAGGR